MEYKRLGWELEELMWRRRIKSAAELARRLKEVGVDVGGIHLARSIKKRPQRLTVELLEGLSIVLDCSMSDLMPVVGKLTQVNDARSATVPAAAPIPLPPNASEVADATLDQARKSPAQGAKPAGTLKVAWDGKNRPKALFPKVERTDEE